MLKQKTEKIDVIAQEIMFAVLPVLNRHRLSFDTTSEVFQRIGQLLLTIKK